MKTTLFANSSTKSRLLTGVGIAVLSLAAYTAPVSAQDIDEDSEASDDDGDLIVVTGSRIARPEVETSAPLVASIDAETLENRNFDNVTEALNEIPGFGIGVSSNGSQSSFSVGQNFVNLFGIGTQRTLTLVNGRRFVSSNTASNFGGAAAGLQVDLNVIPISLIEQVDVLAVRGASIYGSDAIAGTVNLVLKDDFEGMEARGSYAITEHGDGATYRASLTLGTNFADDRGNITVNAEYVDGEGILSTARKRTADQLFFTTPEGDSEFSTVLIQDRRIQPLTRGGLPTRGFGFGTALLPFGGGFTNANGDFVQFAPNGDLVTYDPGGGTGSIVNVSGGDGLNLAETAQISSDLERLTLFALGHYDITDNVKFSFEANYASTSSAELANQPVFQSVLFGGDSGSLGVLLSNPFLNDQARATLLLPGNLADAGGAQVLNFDVDGDGVNDDTRFTLQRASLDLLGGFNPNFGELELFRGLAALSGDLELGGRDFSWQLSYSYGRSQGIATSTSLVQENFINAIDAVVDPDTGNIVCRSTLEGDGGASTSANIANTPETPRAVSGCVPLNLFGDGAPSQEAIDFVTTVTTSESVNTQKIFNANFGGSLFDIMGNPVGINVGYEHRRERQTFTPDGFLQEGLGRSVAISTVDGSFNTNEFFGELLLPIISPSNDSFIYLLEFDGSFRYIDNSLAGKGEAWTVGGRFAPVDDITFRGSYTESIRAPAITELFLPAVSVFAFADDPCDARFIDEGTDPATRAANCAAAGITQPFTSTIADASQQITSSGNPDLLNETSKAWTAGVVLEPSFIPNLSITVDWTDIELTNAIVNLSLEDILISCYDNTDFPNAPTCNQFTRGPNGQITGGQAGFSNAGSFEFAGLQATARYSFDLGNLGDIDILGRYFYLDKNSTTVVGVVDDDRGEIGNFKHKANATIAYESEGGTGLALTGIYMSSAVFDNNDTPTSADILGVGDLFLMDLTLSQEIDDQFAIRFNVDNLFNTNAPYPSAATNTYNSAILGRRYSISVTGKF